MTLSAFTDNLCTVAALGTFAGTLTKAEVAGVADFVANGVNYQKAEGIYIKANDGARTSCSSLITVAPGAAAAVAINTQPVGGNSVDNALTTQPIVHVTDSFGNNVADGVTVTGSLVAGAGTLTGSITAVTAGGAGIATFAGLKYTLAGEAATTTMKFSANGFNSPTSSVIAALLPGAKTQVLWNVQPATSVASTATWTAFSAKVADQYGNTVTTDSASTITIAASTGSIAGTLTRTVASGIATFNDITRTTPTGSLTIGATSTAITAAPDSNTVTVNPGIIDHFTVTGITASHTAGTATSPVVTAYDINNNVKTDYVGTVHFTSTDGAAVLPVDYTFLVGDNGVHTFASGVTLTTAGTRTVTATDTVVGTAAGTQAAITVAPGAADHITYTVQPSGTVQAGVAIATQPSVTVYDVYNNVRSADTTTVTLAAYNDAACTVVGTGTLAGTLTKAEVSGVANFATLGVNYNKIGNFYLGASDGTRTTCSTVIAVTPGPIDHFSLSASPSSLIAGVNSTITITGQDQFNNTVTGNSTQIFTL